MRLFSPVRGLVLVKREMGLSLLANAEGLGADGTGSEVAVGAAVAAPAAIAVNTSGGMPSGRERMSFWNVEGREFHSFERWVEEESRNCEPLMG